MGKMMIGQCLFEPILDAIPNLSYPCEHYKTNSICHATAIAAIEGAKHRVIKEAKEQTHHTTNTGLNTYLTNTAHNLASVENVSNVRHQLIWGGEDATH
jgi:hypothetical protein